ncbi:hypothetical protein [Leclercia tamurae]|uniref:Antitoxin n=1 Tax=Leclercia tamurae TaxID=2926467 RepID=A0ABT2R7M6_9ENTR|nr:hypothetical protein [Leclercia tamurae]MCU6676872.1 hypothetical protein [Leclercia tamurae]
MDIKNHEVARLKRDEMPLHITLHTNELLALAENSDNKIDYSDIAETTDEQWSDAVRGKFY